MSSPTYRSYEPSPASADVQVEDEIVSNSRSLLPKGFHNQIATGLHVLDVSSLNQTDAGSYDTIPHLFGLETRLVVMNLANRLVLYFICMTLAALMGLRDQWRSQRLRRQLEPLFTFLSGNYRPVVIKRLTWPLFNYERCLNFLISAPSMQTVILIISCLNIFGVYRCQIALIKWVHIRASMTQINSIRFDLFSIRFHSSMLC